MKIALIHLSAFMFGVLPLVVQSSTSSTLPTDAQIRDLLVERIDKQHQSVGIVVGVIDSTGRRTVSYGKFDADDKRAVDADTIFEMGSATKVFTSLLLADMVQRGEVALTDPVAKYLPSGVKMPERNGRQITLEDLATHTSGLPRLPSNLHPKDSANPYADYSVEQLYEFLSGYQLTRDIGSQYEYSNLGGGLLGHVLARRAGMDYEKLVRSRICEPLGMRSTGITLSDEMRTRFAVGHDATMQRVEHWDVPTLAGTGALRSTVNDMLTFVAANLGYVKTPLAPAMAAMLAVRRPTGAPGLEVGLGWHILTRDGHEIVWHNGGFRSFIGFERKTGTGVVVLSNAETPAGVDDIGQHLLNTNAPLYQPPKEHKQVAVDPKFFDGYVGQYQLAPNFVMTITRDGAQLFVQATGQPKLEIFPESDRDYFLKVVDAQITFETDSQGRATGLVLHQNGTNQTAKRIQSTTSFAQNDVGDLEQKVDHVFAAYVQPDTPGCALGVVRNGKFIYKRGYGLGSLELGVPLTPESVSYMGSVSKQFTAASVVLAAEQGYLSLDDDVHKYVPELPDYGKPITLRQMLHHTSGFRDILGLLDLSGRNAEDIHPTAEFLDLVSRQKALNYTPGDEYLYSNTNFFLMSVVIPRATGKTLSQFAEENIFKPLGMTHTRFYDDHSVVIPGRVPAYTPRSSGGYRIDWSTNYDKVGDGGLMSSVDDLLLWDRNFYDNKLSKGTLLRELQTPGVLNDGKQIRYALGLGVGKYRGLPTVEHSGGLFGYRTELLRFPQQEFSVICLCNVGTAPSSELAYRVADIYLADKFSSEPSDAAAKVDPHPYAGPYHGLDDHSVLTVNASDNDVEILGDLFKPRDGSHFVSESGAEVAFDRDPKGMRLTLTTEDTAPQIYETYRPAQWSSEDLAQFAGEYASAELEATYRFAAKDGKLTLMVNWQEPKVLKPTVRDEFEGPDGMAIVFRRNANGHITGYDLFAGRVRNIFFTRTAK